MLRQPDTSRNLRRMFTTAAAAFLVVVLPLKTGKFDFDPNVKYSAVGLQKIDFD